MLRMLVLGVTVTVAVQVQGPPAPPPQPPGVPAGPLVSPAWVNPATGSAKGLPAKQRFDTMPKPRH
jgi:hypothetical protein